LHDAVGSTRSGGGDEALTNFELVEPGLVDAWRRTFYGAVGRYT
jgi:hypothetical protein